MIIAWAYSRDPDPERDARVADVAASQAFGGILDLQYAQTSLPAWFRPVANAARDASQLDLRTPEMMEMTE